MISRLYKEQFLSAIRSAFYGSMLKVWSRVIPFLGSGMRK
jgi:hypothetical protein